MLSILAAIILGLVQGITEFLPVSSTGHLILTIKLLDLNNQATQSARDALDAYLIIIQGGTILAVIVLYYEQFKEIFAGIFLGSKEGLNLAVNIFIAFLPAAALGYFFQKAIHTYLFSSNTVILALLVGAVIMLIIDRRYPPDQQKRQARGLEVVNLTKKQALIVGLFQCLSLWPGMSRSMTTITGGVLAGLSYRTATVFSFLLGTVTLLAASGYTMVSRGSSILEALPTGPLLVGIAVAFLSGLIAMKWFVGYLSRNGFGLFAYYRIILALGLIVYLHFFLDL